MIDVNKKYKIEVRLSRDDRAYYTGIIVESNDNLIKIITDRKEEAIININEIIRLTKIGDYE